MFARVCFAAAAIAALTCLVGCAEVAHVISGPQYHPVYHPIGAHPIVVAGEGPTCDYETGFCSSECGPTLAGYCGSACCAVVAGPQPPYWGPLTWLFNLLSCGYCGDGCGETYWGDWVTWKSCEPCDHWGNWVGPDPLTAVPHQPSYTAPPDSCPSCLAEKAHGVRGVKGPIIVDKRTPRQPSTAARVTRSSRHSVFPQQRAPISRGLSSGYPHQTPSPINPRVLMSRQPNSPRIVPNLTQMR